MDAVKHSFGSVGKSMYTLFELMLLEGVADYVRPFVDDLGHLEPMLLFLVFFVFFGHSFVLNWTAAVVVNCMLQAHRAENRCEMTKEALASKLLVKELHRTLFERNGHDDDITEANLKAWTRPGTTAADILAKLKWNA